MMIIPNEESEWVHQVARYIHSPALFIQRDNGLSKRRERIFRKTRIDLKLHLPIRQKG